MSGFKLFIHLRVESGTGIECMDLGTTPDMRNTRKATKRRIKRYVVMMFNESPHVERESNVDLYSSRHLFKRSISLSYRGKV